MAYINFDGHELDIPCGDLVKIVSGSATVSAVGDGTDGAVIALTPSLTGYSPIGLIHVKTSNDSFSFTNVELNGMNANVDVVNLSSSNQTGTLTVTAAYIKDEFIS